MINGIKRLLKISILKKRNKGKSVKLNIRCNPGLHCSFGGYNKIGANTAFEGKIGFGSYIGQNCSINGCIGKYCSISHNVVTLIGSHPSHDYKFYCMNGKSMYVMVCEDREIGKKAKYFYFDKAWNMMPYSQDALDDPDRVIPKPEGIDLAFEYAEKLSKEFPFVRVDLYIVDGKVYFGELTFTPSAGLDTGRLPATDRILGDQLVLPTK